VQCVLYHRTDQGGFAEREHSQSWPDFLEDLQGEVECPPYAAVGKSTRPPKWIKPQFTRLVEEAPTGKDWAHEIKYDRYRMHARIDGGKVALLTRTGLDWSHRYRRTIEALALSR
jgi:hypothetical protein